ncbi:tyrosine-type recombinase/integrase [Brevundimonas sp.]
MVKVVLKGVHTVRMGERTYHYAWRGGPRIMGVPGSPEFIAAYTDAHASRKVSDDGKMRGLVANYRGSKAFNDLAPSTRKIWNRWLDKVVERFGDYRVGLFDHPDKIRPIIKRWRDQWADRPRSADYAIQVLSRVLTHAVDLDRISTNPCEGIKSLYSADRSDIIWTDDDLKAVEGKASPEVWHGINLAAHTGFRAEDLRRLSWSHIGEFEIVIPTNKSRGGKSAFVPLYDDLRAVLASIPRRSTTVLTNEKGRPWKDGPNGSGFMKARDEALPGRDLHFHDLRGTFATRAHMAGLSNREIAELLAWEEARVEQIIRRYVGRRAIAQGMIQKLNANRPGT